MIGDFKGLVGLQDQDLLVLLTLASFSLKSGKSSVLPALGLTFDLETVSKMAHLFGGCTIAIPSPEDLELALTEVLCLYYRKYRNMDWDEIRKRVPYEFDSQGMSRRVNVLYEKITPELSTLFLSIRLPETGKDDA